jgi:hypothetical protein
MELRQRHVIKIVHAKSLELAEIVMELSDTYRGDA